MFFINAKTASRLYIVFPLTFTPRSRTLFVVKLFFIGWWTPPGRDDAKLVFMSCPISTASCTLNSISETTISVHDVVQCDWCVSGCEWFHSSVKIFGISSSSRLLLPYCLCFAVVAADAGHVLELYIPSIAMAR